MRSFLSSALIFALLSVSACSSAHIGAASSPRLATSPRAVQAGLRQVHDPRVVTGTLEGPCHAAGPLPDPGCTPGSTDPAVTQASIRATICHAGYTATVRPPASATGTFKYTAEAAYGLPRGTAAELDHGVPLELGGSNDATNLWPEPYAGTEGARVKDKVENALHAAVCAGRVRLAAAQLAIAHDWVTAEHVLGLTAP